MAQTEPVEINALLARIAAVRWCEPDTEMEQQTPSAVQWLEERVDALRAFAPDDEDGLSLRVVRSETELARRFRAGLKRAMQGPLYEAFERSHSRIDQRRRKLGIWGEGAINKIEKAIRHPIEGSFAATRGTDDAREPYRGDELTRAAREQQVRPGALALQLHAEWALYFGRAEPSPWEPLFECLERGTWPVLLRGELLVWVPVMHDGVIEDPAPMRLARTTDVTPVTTDEWLEASAEQIKMIPDPGEEEAFRRYRRVGLAIPPRRFVPGERDRSELGAMPGSSVDFERRARAAVATPQPARGDGAGAPENAREGVATRFWNWLTGNGSGET